MQLTAYILIFILSSRLGFSTESEKTVPVCAPENFQEYRVHLLPQGLFYNNQTFLDLRGEGDPELKTIVVRVNSGPPLEETRYTGVFLHGNGSERSHVGSVLNQIGIVGAAKAKKRKGRAFSLAREVFNLENFALGYILGFDLPGHGQGVPLTDVPTLDEFIALMDLAFRNVKSENPSKPLVIFARSGSGPLVAEYNKRHPGVVDFLIGLNPQNPYMVDYSVDLLINGKDGLKFDVPLLLRIQEYFHQMTWYQQGQPFGEMKTLFLVGRKDPELNEEYENGLREIIARQPGAEIYFSQDGGHDVLAPRDFYRQTDQKEAALAAYKVIFDFLAKHGI